MARLIVALPLLFFLARVRTLLLHALFSHALLALLSRAARAARRATAGTSPAGACLGQSSPGNHFNHREADRYAVQEFHGLPTWGPRRPLFLHSDVFLPLLHLDCEPFELIP